MLARTAAFRVVIRDKPSSRLPCATSGGVSREGYREGVIMGEMEASGQLAVEAAGRGGFRG